MMKTRLNRALATCLVFAMMLSIMSVCAGAVSDPSAPEAKVQMSNTEVQATNDATMDAKALLQKMGISGDAALEERVSSDLRLMEGTIFRYVPEIHSIQDDGIVYAMQFESLGVTDFITVQQADNGDRVISVTEDDKEDTLVYQVNGHIYLNGDRLEACELYDTEKVEIQDISPARVGMQFTMRVAPTAYFKQGAKSVDECIQKSGYRFMGVTSRNDNIPLNKPLKELTIGIIKNTLVSATMSMLVSKTFALATTLKSSILSTALTSCNKYMEAAILKYGNSKGLSCQIFKYANSKNDTLYAEFVYTVVSYSNTYLMGDTYLWGVREEGYAT